ncbi:MULTISPECIES: hypothetical protein [Psychrobacter]|uniref:hypothetical protein n=1 Tax=Psychrobacter TaxID=497 RepID=UPI0015E8C48B|nr:MULTISPECIES: hypothetical protein [Psychrobacter]MBH0064560.1 hypothetical protein [Psychrobacter sp. SZ93C1]MBH0085950.1 hypothetical protein [Psychrobacter sp. SCQQ22]
MLIIRDEVPPELYHTDSTRRTTSVWKDALFRAQTHTYGHDTDLVISSDLLVT